MLDAEPPSDPSPMDKPPRIAELILKLTAIVGLFSLLFALLHLIGAFRDRPA